MGQKYDASFARLITARKRNLGQGYIFTPVYDSLYKWCTPPANTPPPRQTPPRQTLPWVGPLPGQIHTLPSRRQLKRVVTHPTGMHSCFTFFSSKPMFWMRKCSTNILNDEKKKTRPVKSIWINNCRVPVIHCKFFCFTVRQTPDLEQFLV